MALPIQSILHKLGQDEIGRLRSLRPSLGLSGIAAAETPMATIPRDGPLPLSYAQQRLWFLAQLEDVSVTYHILLSVRLHGPLDHDALRAALDGLFARHEGLRTVFLANDGEPQVRLLPADAGIALRAHDLRADADPPAALQAIADEELRIPFDLARDRLIRARIVRLRDEEYELLITQHHIVSDGWSIGVLARDFSALYTAAVQGRPDPLPPLRIQYPDYAAWQREWLSGARLDSQTAYWRRALDGAPRLLELPTDRPRPPLQSFAAGCVPLRLEPRLTRALKRLSQQHGTTLFMTLMTAWAAVLARLSGQDDLVIGTPIAHRNRAEIQSLIGFFVNTLALRVDLSGDPTLAQLLARVRSAALAAQDHQDLPFERVVELTQPQRRLDHTPLFQVMFAWQSNEDGVFDLYGLRAEPPQLPADTLKVDLELHLSETGEAADAAIGGTLYYSTALFDADTIDRHCGYLMAMLRAMVADAGQALDTVELISAQERELQLQRFNRDDGADQREPAKPGGGLTEPAPRVQHLFERQARATPEAIAVVHHAHSLSYARLDLLANRLAHRLIEHGAQPGQPVALCVDRGVPMVVALLAILKTGCAYLPLDPAYPAERLAQMLDDAAPPLLLSDAAGRAALGAAVDRCAGSLDLDGFAWDAPFNSEPQAHDLAPAARACGEDDDEAAALAYLIYTSGSTGVPKGVAMPHAPLLNLLRWQDASLPRGQTTLQFAALGFDVAFQEMFGALSTGARLVLIDAQTRLDFPALIDLLGAQQVQRLHLPYIALQSLAEAAADCDEAQWAPLRHGLREVIVAGEQLRITPQIRRLFQRLPQCRLHNHYGPTETHVATAHTLDAAVESWPDHAPIGRPIDGARIYLLDARQRPVPLGAIGEIHIGGAAVAQGYRHRPQMSAERFLADPFAQRRGARMYRTGDLARYSADGGLIFLGRNDHQIKIRGFRVEPGEIEARLAEHPAVAETAVIAREDRPGDKRLVAYVIAHAHAMPPAEFAANLRAHLSARLPEHMLPAAFVVLDALPLTPHGKLDRKALPAPDESALARQHFEPPCEGAETELAQIWRSLLHRQRIGRDDHFFELGGHSLLAAQLAARIARARGVALSVREVFQRPLLRDMAGLLAPAVAPRERVDLAAEVRLDDDIRAQPSAPPSSSPEHVLLTGASGFLGAFLLTGLLAKTDAIVHCLIRCDDPAQGRARLQATLAGFGLSDRYRSERVTVVPGDLARPRFGLSVQDFTALADTVGSIYHNGAWVNSLHSYQTLKAANVLGTEEVLRLASLGRHKHIHYVSTMGTLPPPADGVAADTLTEDELFAHWQGLSAGYTQSKWVAENLLRLGATRGLAYTVYRPTHISGASDSGISNDSDTWSLFIDACLHHRCVPDLDGALNWLPVDAMSELIVDLSLRDGLHGRHLNLSHPQSFSLRRLTEAVIASDGPAVAVLPYRQWHARCAADAATRNIAAILPADIGATPGVSKPFGGARVGNAVADLEAQGRACPPVDDGLLSRYVAWRNRARPDASAR